MVKTSRIYVAGHKGLVGAAILRKLQSQGYMNLLTRNSHSLDLTRQADVEAFFLRNKPEYVLLAAAKVGGILANATYPAHFIYNNLMIQANIVHAAYLSGVKKLLFLGSSCIYPRDCPQPIKEEYLLSGFLETTNEPYAIAKIAGIKMCQSYNRQYGTNFISVMPTNIYGPGDNFELQNSHVLPAMIRKFCDAKLLVERCAKEGISSQPVTLWGTGTPQREFLHVDDLADACVFLMQGYESGGIINVGTGKDISIKELAALIMEILDFKCAIRWDTAKPDGTPRKLLDVSKIKALGWEPKITLRKGIKMTFEWYLKMKEDV